MADDDSVLDELFVEGARIHEPSARERAAAARAAAREAKVRRRRARRFHWRVRAGRLVTYAVVLGVVVATWWSMSRSNDAAGPQQPSRARVLYASLDDSRLDASIVPAIRNEIGVVQQWFATQTGGRELDFVTGDDGAVEVSPVRMDIAGAQLRERSDAAALVIDELSARRSDSASDFLVVFVPVRFEHQVRCGEESGGGVAVVWVGSCGEVPSTSSRVLGDGTTRTLAHELVHALAAVARCAPHYGNNGHVTDDPHDLLYDGPQRPATPIVLDPGHDDYWKSGNRDCDSDISRHPMWRQA